MRLGATSPRTPAEACKGSNTERAKQRPQLFSTAAAVGSKDAIARTDAGAASANGVAWAADAGGADLGHAVTTVADQAGRTQSIAAIGRRRTVYALAGNGARAVALIDACGADSLFIGHSAGLATAVAGKARKQEHAVVVVTVVVKRAGAGIAIFKAQVECIGNGLEHVGFTWYQPMARSELVSFRSISAVKLHSGENTSGAVLASMRWQESGRKSHKSSHCGKSRAATPRPGSLVALVVARVGRSLAATYPHPGRCVDSQSNPRDDRIPKGAVRSHASHGATVADRSSVDSVTNRAPEKSVGPQGLGLCNRGRVARNDGCGAKAASTQKNSHSQRWNLSRCNK